MSTSTDWPPWGDGRSGPIARLLHSSTLAVRHLVVDRTPFAPQYEWLVERSRRIWWRMQSRVEAAESLGTPAPADAYDQWLEVNAWNHRALEHLRSRLDASCGQLPRLSVVMPVFDPEADFLERALQSVAAQVYGNWELCVADDHSHRRSIRATLRRWAVRDRRVRLAFRSENGNISAASNTAASLATGEFLLFLDHDDELHPAALGEVALYLAEHPDTDFMYSDDDKIDRRGRRFAPQFKPDWSPELLLSYMYLSHLCAVRRRLFEELGGFRLGFEGSQDHDFALRATEASRQVGHLPLVLYHWRSVPRSTASRGSAKSNGFSAGQRAVEEALARRNVGARVHRPRWAVDGDVGIFECEFPDQGPSVTIVIPTRNQPELLQRCLSSLIKTTYRNYEVVVVDNGSNQQEAIALLRTLPHRVLRIPSPHGRFNFAAVVNRAVADVGSEFVVLLNDDTEVIAPRWLSQMVGWGQVPGVGAVGAKLVFPDGRIQHAGVVRGVHHGLPGHAFKLWPPGNNGYLSYVQVARNCSAVTAACMLTPRRLFREMGGLDEVTFGVAYNDADYCLRLEAKGYRSVYCPSAELIHREGASRGHADEPREQAAFRKKYPERTDRFYSPHLALENAQWEIRPRRWFQDGTDDVRVLAWSQALDLTGAPLHQFELVVALRDRGAALPSAVSVADGPLRHDYVREGIPLSLRSHPLAAVHDAEQYERAIAALADELRGQDCDVIYANTLDSFFVVEAAHRARIPSVWNLHESEPVDRYFLGQELWLKRRVEACFRWPYRLIYVSDASRAVFASLDRCRRATVIHNALEPRRLERAARSWTRLDARASLNIEVDDVAVFALGTVCERKGQHDLVHAVRCLPADVAGRIRYFIVGDRALPYGQELRGLVACLPPDLRERVSVVPETPLTAQYYRAADIFVCCSRVESFPRVILEAMSYELPIVTTPVFGIPEQVREGRNALFYTPGAAEELADRLRRLAEDAELRGRLGANARYVLDSLGTFDEVAEQYGQIMREAYLAGG
jgi:GT2 family glycosyltransferase/glycosyltransferase involved in cell wall biosynthesis